MSVPAPGAIDCDIHPALPSMQALVPYLDEYWRSHILMRGLERDNYTASAFPPNAPINCRRLSCFCSKRSTSFSKRFRPT